MATKTHTTESRRRTKRHGEKARCSEEAGVKTGRPTGKENGCNWAWQEGCGGTEEPQ